MPETNLQRELRKRKRCHLENTAKKYPLGFTSRMLFNDDKDLFKNYVQAKTFMLRSKKEDGRISTVVSGSTHTYFVNEDPYKLLNKLWRTT